MTKDEAREILKNCSSYIGDGVSPDEIVLDGSFTKEQLQAILLLDFADPWEKAA